jgi:hypothetical protein
MRQYRSGSLFAPVCTRDGGGSEVRPLRLHPHEGGAYNTRSLAGNERRALPEILIVNVGAVTQWCRYALALFELGTSPLIREPMWLLFFSISVYTIYGALSGHFRHKFTPISPRRTVTEVLDFLQGKLGHELGERNAVQKLLYTFAVLCMLLMVWSGLVLWNPVQFEELGVPLGDYQRISPPA